MAIFIQSIPRSGMTQLRVFFNIYRKEYHILNYNKPIDGNIILNEIKRKQSSIVFSNYLPKNNEELFLHTKSYILLRNPIESAIGIWAHHYSTGWTCGHKNARSMSKAEFQKNIGDLYNGICRLILNLKYDIPLSNNDIDRVIEKIQTFDIVENYENYNNFIYNLSKNLSTEIKVYYTPLTFGKLIPITQQEFYEIKNVLKFDCEVYEQIFNKPITYDNIRK